MKKLIALPKQVQRSPGRPRVGDERIWIILPKAAIRVLTERGDRAEVSRARVAAGIICNWASRETGTVIAPYDLGGERGPLR